MSRLTQPRTARHNSCDSNARLRSAGVLAAMVLSATVSCGGSSSSSASPVAPSSPSLTGNWAGTSTTVDGASSAVTMQLTASNSSVTGSWTSATGNNETFSGLITGTVSGGSSVTLELETTDQTLCPYTVTATYTNTSLEGTWVTHSCTTTSSGSLSMTRQ